ncbi:MULTISPECIES: transporter [unclassified Agrobacterium]|uniref:SphA family protein n=1 Tax=unclassified Agrobacterium TaxID=2632611 RepID=UPI0010085A51|nr:MULTISPECIES: transporter [unclassified Agrobacterium]QKX00268.1 transporter [Agrobacterium sp. CGMCC 11546]
MRSTMKRCIPLLLSAVAIATASGAYAAEGAAGFYLLGSKGPAAAVMPPAGVYFQNDMYFYSGDLGGGAEFPSGGKFAVGVEGKAALNIPTVIWILPEDVMGGKLGLSATLPIGWKETSADATITGPLGGVLSGGTTDVVFTAGDPLVSAFVGWEKGNLHWQIGTMINVPIGDYQKGEISNIAFHHWGADVFAAATWLDPSTGFDLSGVVGMTFNAENPATDYRTGNEFHFEWAAVQHFNEQFDAGLVGYYYNQVTGDSGDGARGDFQGRAAAIGATIGWNFKAGETPIAARLKYFHEFGVENRARGDAVFLTISMPLSVAAPVSVAAQ